MYKYRKYLKPYKIIKKFPLYSKIFNKSLRSIIYPEVIKLVKNKTNETLKKKRI